MHFGWGKNVCLLCFTGFVALPFPVIFLHFFFHCLFFIMSHLSLGKKEAIVILHMKGFSHRKIAKELSYDRRTIDQEVFCRRETGSIERQDGSVLPKGSKPMQDAMLEKLCLADRKASTAELTVKWRKRTRCRVDLHPSS